MNDNIRYEIIIYAEAGSCRDALPIGYDAASRFLASRPPVYASNWPIGERIPHGKWTA